MRRIFNTLFYKNYSINTHPNSPDLKLGLKKIKSFVELLSSKDIEKELTLDEVKKFYGLTNITKDYLESNIIESVEIKEKIHSIVQMNKDLDKNLDLTRYLYRDLQREKNDFIFKLLLANTFSSLKKNGDEDSSLLEYMQYICANLKTINPKLLNKSESLFFTFQQLTKDISSQENYKAVDTLDMVSFLNVFPSIDVNVVEEDMFKYHSQIIFEEKMKDLERFNDNGIVEVFDYFEFYLKFKNSCLNLKQRLDMKQKFKEYFKKNMINIIKLAESNSELEENVNVALRYDEILNLISNSGVEEGNIESFDKSSQFLRFCEYLLNIKLNKHICPLSVLLEIAMFYTKKNMMNKSILHFIAFNCIEHLKLEMTLATFENQFIKLYAIICANIEVIPNSETISEFFEQFKASIFHNKFLDVYSTEIPYKEPELETDLNTISIKALDLIYLIHKGIVETEYFDSAFDRYLYNVIKLNKSLVSIH